MQIVPDEKGTPTLVVIAGEKADQRGSTYVLQYNPDLGKAVGAWMPNQLEINPIVGALIAEGKQNGGGKNFNIGYKGGFGTGGSGNAIKDFARQLLAAGQPTVILSKGDEAIGADLAEAAYARGVKVNLFGHSLGGASAVATARLAPQVIFSNLVTLDAVCFTGCRSIPENVRSNRNFYQDNSWFGWFPHGGRNEAENPASTVIKDRYLNDPDVTHFNILGYSADTIRNAFVP